MPLGLYLLGGDRAETTHIFLALHAHGGCLSEPAEAELLARGQVGVVRIPIGKIGFPVEVDEVLGDRLLGLADGG